MTSKERILKSMNFEFPDRVPVMCQFSIGHILIQTNISPAELWFSADVFQDVLIDMRERYKFDGILISLHGHNPNWKNQVREIKKEEKGEIVYWKNGDTTFCYYDDLPQHFTAKKNKIRCIDEIDINMVSETINYIPVSQGLYFNIDHDNKFKIFDDLNNKIGSEFSIHSEITSPFDYLLDLLGQQNALLSLFDQPERCLEILQKFTNGIISLSIEMCNHNIDAIKISSPYAGAGFLSPQFYRKFVLPFEIQIVKEIRNNNKHVYIHTCGNIGDRLELIADSGVSGLECLDPPPIGNVDLHDAKKRLGNKCFIKGNIDSVNILLNKSREEVKLDATERLRIGKEGSGFILSTACSIAPYVPKENVEMLYEVVEEYGRY